MERRSLLIASGSIPLSLIAARPDVSKLTPELVSARDVIAAFFFAGNAANWQFVDEALADFCHAETNHRHWSFWAKTLLKDQKNVQSLLEKRPQGYLPDRNTVLDFFRSRQYKKGWEWSLPNGKNSIWSPATNVYCAFSKWKRVDGGSYWKGSIDHSPTFLHLFGLKTIKQFGSTVSSKIDWIQEIDIRNIIYG